ncbi:MAG: VCBS repeat-containing protein [Planctomycetota bacterium]
MADHREGAPTRRPGPVPPILVTAFFAAGAIPAQAAHPFAPPVTAGTFGFDSTVGLADFDRDGSHDMLVPGLFYGTLITSMDEHGNPLAVNRPGPAIGISIQAGALPFPVCITCGRVDGDLQDDAIMISNAGTAHVLRCVGATVLGGNNFAPDVLFDDFSAQFPCNPPFVALTFPTAELVDIDGDGDNDLLLAGGPLDRWSGNSLPGFVCIYEGDGAGGFVPHRVTVPGNVVDAELVDFDGDGVREQIVVLVEMGAVGAFSNEVLHFAINGCTPVQVGAGQPVGPGRLTALELGDVDGDGELDYLLAQTAFGALSPAAAIYWFAGDGTGNVSTGTWGLLPLPAPNALGDHVNSMRVGDWNRDSHPDLAVLRGYTQAPASALGTATYGESELLVAMGPMLANATFEAIPLGGHHAFNQASSSAANLLPLDGEPQYLHVVDLGHDGDLDLLIGGMRESSGPAQMFSLTLRNETPPQPGDARFEKVGEPTGGVATRKARIGFEGGRPEPGNADFACTILNVQAGSLVGLMWGPIAAPGMIPLPMYGFDVHLLPAFFGYARIAAGNGFDDGFTSYPLPIPNTPYAIGDAGYFQYNYYDPVSGTFGGTQATGVWIGD